MATAPLTTTSQDRADAVRGAARATLIGLVWGGAMLLLLALWRWAKTPETASALPWLLGVCGLVALALAAWQANALWLQKLATDALTRQRSALGLVLVAGGVALLALDCFLAFRWSPTFGVQSDSFGEAAGLMLFALLTFYAGLALRGDDGDPASSRLLDFVQRMMPFVKLKLLIVSLLLVGVFCYLAFFKKLGLDYAPEYFALLTGAMLYLAVFFWLIAGDSGPLDPFALRVFILAVGGATGLILFLMTLGRAWVWRQELFLGGMAAWQTDNAWRLWLVIYVQLAALALLFGSLYLARGDVRESALLRRLLYGYNSLLAALLVLEILVVVNLVFYALVPYNFDWSRGRGAYALSEATKNLLGGLKKETHVVVLLPPGHEIYSDVHQLLDNCQTQTSRLDVKYVNPDVPSSEYETLLQRFPKIRPEMRGDLALTSGRGVLIVYGAMPENEQQATPHTFIPERKLHETSGRGDKQKRVFKGEGEIMKELNFLAREQKSRKVYFLQDDAEADVNAMQMTRRSDMRLDLKTLGVGVLADKLRKDNYEVKGLSFEAAKAGDKTENLLRVQEGADKKKDIPADTYALAIAGPSRRLTSEAQEALERYLERGGRLLVFLDVVAENDFSGLRTSGLEPLLNRYGVKVGTDYAMRLSGNPLEPPSTLIATPPDDSEQPLAKQFFRQPLVMRNYARVVRASETPGRFKTETILQLDPRLEVGRSRNFNLVETNARALMNPIGYLRELSDSGELQLRVREEPIPVGVAVSEKESDKPRLVVFGDTEFATNAGLISPRDHHYTLVVSALEWMAEREGLVGPRPKESSIYTLEPTTDTLRIVLLPGWIMLVALLGLGTGIWLVRRR